MIYICLFLMDCVCSLRASFISHSPHLPDCYTASGISETVIELSVNRLKEGGGAVLSFEVLSVQNSALQYSLSSPCMDTEI